MTVNKCHDKNIAFIPRSMGNQTIIKRKGVIAFVNKEFNLNIIAQYPRSTGVIPAE